MQSDDCFIVYFVIRNSFITFVGIMANQQTSICDRTKTSVRPPQMYKVIIFNDDFTTMEFVVDVLMEVFLKNENEANQIMLKVHHSGSAVVGIYTYDIAKSRVRSATNMARYEGFPLRLEYQPE